MKQLYAITSDKYITYNVIASTFEEAVAKMREHTKSQPVVSADGDLNLSDEIRIKRIEILENLIF